MQLKVPYKEIRELVCQSTGKNISLSTINQSTVNVGYELTFRFFGERTKHIDLPVCVDSITGSDVYLSVPEKMEMVAHGVLHFIDCSFIIDNSGDGFVLHLKEIPQLSAAIDKIQIENLIFADGGATVDFGVKL